MQYSLGEAAHHGINTMRGLFKADFTIACHPQAALRLHAVNYAQPFQGCIATGLLLILIPNSRINKKLAQKDEPPPEPNPQYLQYN